MAGGAAILLPSDNHQQGGLLPVLRETKLFHQAALGGRDGGVSLNHVDASTQHNGTAAVQRLLLRNVMKETVPKCSYQ